MMRLVVSARETGAGPSIFAAGDHRTRRRRRASSRVGAGRDDAFFQITRRRFVLCPLVYSMRRREEEQPPLMCSSSSSSPPPPSAVATSDVYYSSDHDQSPLTPPPPPRMRMMMMDIQNMEEQLEKVIYRCRFFTLLGVSGSLVGSILCFLKGCTYIASSFMNYFLTGGKVISMVIEAIDIYLIGTVMLVFGMGLYELFISNLDIAKTSSERSNLFGLFKIQERPRWLEIQSVNELKTKLGHAIVMVLLVGLFDKVQKVVISTPNDLLCFTASILLLSCGLYLLSKLADNPKQK